MPITPVSKNQAMRPAEISAIDAINEIINTLENLDVSSISETLNILSNSVESLNTRVDGIAQTTTTINSTLASISSDVDDIKVTLYTPLDQTIS